MARVDQEQLFEFQELKNVLNEWLSLHQKVILTAHLNIQDDGLLFIIIRKDPEYDRQFDDMLSELDLAIANDPRFSRFYVSVMQLPSSFLDRNCRVWADSCFHLPEWTVTVESSALLPFLNQPFALLR